MINYINYFELILFHINSLLKYKHIFNLLCCCQSINKIYDNLFWKEKYIQELENSKLENISFLIKDIPVEISYSKVLLEQNFKKKLVKILYHQLISKNNLINRSRKLFSYICTSQTRFIDIDKKINNITKYLKNIRIYLVFKKLQGNNLDNRYSQILNNLYIKLRFYFFIKSAIIFRENYIEQHNIKKHKFLNYLNSNNMSTYFHHKFNISEFLYNVYHNLWIEYSSFNGLYMRFTNFRQIIEDELLLLSNNNDINVIIKKGLISTMYAYYQYGEEYQNEYVISYESFINYYVHYYRFPRVKSSLHLIKYIMKITNRYKLFRKIGFNKDYILSKILI